MLTFNDDQTIVYKCADCGATGVQLWRNYQTFLDHQTLRCTEDAKKNQEGKERTGDSIGWLVPAVLTDDRKTFWGYTSVPQDAVEAWRALPVTAPA